MSVWDHIDQLKRHHEQAFTETTNALEPLRAIKGSLTTDEFGLWRCRYIPKGQRAQAEVSARDGGGLVERLKAIRAKEEGR